MSRWDDLEESFQVGDLTVEIMRDDYPDRPDESEGEDLFLISFHEEFRAVNKRWDCIGDFSSFVLPKYREEIVDAARMNLISGTDEPTEQPMNGPEDARWRQVYLEECPDQLEVLLAECGALTEWSNEEAQDAAFDDTIHRLALWRAWKEYRAAHAEWACFELHVRYHGGGSVTLSLGNIYDGDHTDTWGRETDGPDGFVMLRKAAGFGTTVDGVTTYEPRAVAQSHVDTWTQYLDGDVWRWRLLDESNEEVEAGGSYYGLDYCRAAAIESAESINKWNNKQVPLFEFPSIPPGVV
jgi:hypothetical protein